MPGMAGCLLLPRKQSLKDASSQFKAVANLVWGAASAGGAGTARRARHAAGAYLRAPPAPLQPCPHAGKQHSSANLAGKSYMYITKHVDGDVGSVWLSRTFSQRYRRGNRSERKTKGTKKNIPKI